MTEILGPAEEPEDKLPTDEEDGTVGRELVGDPRTGLFSEVEMAEEACMYSAMVYIVA